jgi:hypothetical protein
MAQFIEKAIVMTVFSIPLVGGLALLSLAQRPGFSGPEGLTKATGVVLLLVGIPFLFWGYTWTLVLSIGSQ